MNTEVYNRLLSYSKTLLRSKPLIINEYDIVHEVWDFKESDFHVVKKKVAKVFFEHYKKESATVRLHEYRSKSKNLDDQYRQCKSKTCLKVLPSSYFVYSETNKNYEAVCKECKSKRQTLRNRSKGTKPAKVYLPYDECRDYVIKNIVPEGINSREKWAARTSDLPEDIPKSPQNVYSNGKGWISWMHFFGKQAQS